MPTDDDRARFKTLGHAATQAYLELINAGAEVSRERHDALWDKWDTLHRTWQDAVRSAYAPKGGPPGIPLGEIQPTGWNEKK